MDTASRRARSTSGRRRCATSCAPSSGRWRARRWPASRGADLDVLGLRAARAGGGGPALRDPRRQDPEPRHLRARERRRRPRTRRRSRRSSASTTPEPARSRRGSWCRCVPADHAELEELLRDACRRRRVRLSVPQRGEGRELMALAARNAAETLDARAGPLAGRPGQDRAALEELAEALGLPAAARRASSASTSAPIQGTSTVGSMVVFEEGRPRTGEYRRFRIRGVAGQDDFASHQEVLRRRFRRALGADEGSAEQLRWRLPDLVIIDGGKGQVSAGTRGARRARPPRPAAGRASPRSARSCSCRVAATPSCCPPRRRRCTWCSGSATRRTASPITYHRQVRARAAQRSALDDLQGVGPGAQARAPAGLRVEPCRCAARASRRSPRCRASVAALAERIRAHLRRAERRRRPTARHRVTPPACERAVCYCPGRCIGPFPSLSSSSSCWRSRPPSCRCRASAASLARASRRGSASTSSAGCAASTRSSRRMPRRSRRTSSSRRARSSRTA